MIIHQRSIPLTCLTASIAKPIKYDKEHDLIGCKKSRCLSPDLDAYSATVGEDIALRENV